MTQRDLDPQRIAAVRTALQAAENAFDADAAAALLTDDAVLMVPDFPVQEGRAACAAFLRDILGWLAQGFERHVEYTSDEITIWGDVALDRGRFAFTTTSKESGDTTHVTGKYLWLLRSDDDSGWLVTRLIASRDQEDSGSAAGTSC